MNPWGNGITVTAGVIALIIAAVAHGLPRPKRLPQSIPWPTDQAQLCLVIGGTVGVLGGKVGTWVHNITTWINDSAAAHWWVGIAGVGLFLAIGVAVAGFLYKRVHKGMYDTRTLTLGAALPVVSISVPGTIGAVLLWICGVMAWLVSTVVNFLFF